LKSFHVGITLHRDDLSYLVMDNQMFVQILGMLSITQLHKHSQLITCQAISIISVLTLWLTRTQEKPNSAEITPLVWPPPYYPEWPNTIEYCVPHPDNTRFRNQWTSQLLQKFPFLVEVIYFNVALFIYQGFRAITVLYVNVDPIRKIELELSAKQNAVNILEFEQKVPLAFELLIQQFISIQCMPWVMVVLCYIYLAQVVVIFGFLAYGFTFVLLDLARSRGKYILAH